MSLADFKASGDLKAFERSSFTYKIVMNGGGSAKNVTIDASLDGKLVGTLNVGNISGTTAGLGFALNNVPAGSQRYYCI